MDELRQAFVQTYSPDFELVSDEVREHDGRTYWLASVKATRSGEFVFRHGYESPGYGHRYHDNECRIFIGEKGCRRELSESLRPQTFCVGDTAILPMLVGKGLTHHTFRRVSRFPEYYVSPFQTALDSRPIGISGLSSVLTYLGREAHPATNRSGTRTTVQLVAFFEAAGTGRLNLELSPRWPASMQQARVLTHSILVVPPDSPITALVAEESTLESDEASETPRASSSGGNNYRVSVTMLRPGDRISLSYGTAVVMPGAEAADAAQVEPVVHARPFAADTSGFSGWLPAWMVR